MIDCKQCPHVVGDIRERDCDFPDCVLSTEQIEILRHTARNNVFCGGGPDMDSLCESGLMEYIGRKFFVPDPYYRITAQGRGILRDLPND